MKRIKKITPEDFIKAFENKLINAGKTLTEVRWEVERRYNLFSKLTTYYHITGYDIVGNFEKYSKELLSNCKAIQVTIPIYFYSLIIWILDTLKSEGKYNLDKDNIYLRAFNSLVAFVAYGLRYICTGRGKKGPRENHKVCFDCCRRKFKKLFGDSTAGCIGFDCVALFNDPLIKEKLFHRVDNRIAHGNVVTNHSMGYSFHIFDEVNSSDDMDEVANRWIRNWECSYYADEKNCRYYTKLIYKGEDESLREAINETITITITDKVSINRIINFKLAPIDCTLQMGIAIATKLMEIPEEDRVKAREVYTAHWNKDENNQDGRSENWKEISSRYLDHLTRDREMELYELSSSVSRTQRWYNKACNMPKDVLKYAKVNGRELLQVDAKSAQFVLMSLLFSEDYMDVCPEECHNLLTNVVKYDFYTEILNTVKDLYHSDSEYRMMVDSQLCDKPEFTNSIYNSVEEMIDAMDRGTMKGFMFPLVFCTIFAVRGNWIFHAIKHKYPNFAQWILETGGEHQRDSYLPILLQNTEARLFIGAKDSEGIWHKGALQYMYEMDLFGFTKHDSIISFPENIPFITGILTLMYVQRFPKSMGYLDTVYTDVKCKDGSTMTIKASHDLFKVETLGGDDYLNVK